MLERPAARQRPRPGRRAPQRGRSTQDLLVLPPVAGAAAGVWAAGVGLFAVGVLVTVVWAVTGRGDDGLLTPLGAAGVIWLAGQHVGVTTATATVTLLPLLLLAADLALLVVAGRWAVRASSTRTWPAAGALIGAGAAAYAVLGVLVASVGSLAGATASPVTAALLCAVTAAAGLGTGVLVGSPLGAELRDLLPAPARDGLLAAAALAGALTCAVALVAAVAVLLRWSTVVPLTHQLAPGPGDALGVLLLSLAYLPNLLVWVLAYVAGPGFGLGADAGVGPFAQSGALLPGVPLLGAVPEQAPAAAPLLLLVVVACGAVAAVVLRHRRHLGLGDEVVALVVGSVVVGVGSGLLAALSGGALGGGRLVGLGPAPLATGLAVAGLSLAGALLVSLGTHLLPTLWVAED